MYTNRIPKEESPSSPQKNRALSKTEPEEGVCKKLFENLFKHTVEVAVGDGFQVLLAVAAFTQLLDQVVGFGLVADAGGAGGIQVGAEGAQRLSLIHI